MQRLFVAGALLLFVVPLFPTAPAQSASDPWWGESDRTRPTAGFSVRVPVTVENKFDYFLHDPFVAVELDFQSLLVEAGWTNQTVGAETRLRGFTLDVDSIRVVPYHRGFVTGPIEGSAQKPIAHTFYPALFESSRHRDFDPARSPAGTVMFQIDTKDVGMRPGEKRDFYIYAKPLEYGKTEPHKPEHPSERGGLDAFLWGTTGTVAYGYEPGQLGQRHLIRVTSLASGLNKVTVSTLELGRYVPLPTSPTYPNPYTLQMPGEGRFFLVPAGKAYKVEADRPVRVEAFGQHPDTGVTSSNEARMYYPGASGSFVDDAFQFYGTADHPNAFHFVKISPGNVDVRVSVPGAGVDDSFTLTNANPYVGRAIPPPSLTNGGLYTIASTNGGKFMVFVARPQGELNLVTYPPHQVPSNHGGVSGTSFWNYLMNENGFVRICPESNLTMRIVDRFSNNQQVLPEGNPQLVPPATITQSLFCQRYELPPTLRAASPWEFFSVPAPNAPSGVPLGNFRLYTGAGERSTSGDDARNFTRPELGPVGGLGGVDYHLHGSAGIFGHYNGTRVTIFEERERADGTTYVVNRTRGVQRDEYFTLSPGADSTGRWRIFSTKPVSAFSLADAMFTQVDTSTNEVLRFTIPYHFHVPGRPVMPDVTVGQAQFRGPLIDLRAEAAPFLTTGPASPVNFRLDVLNLGRWSNNEDLPDTITVSCATPQGWRVDGCASEVTLGSRSSERLNLVITPSADDVNVTRSIVVEARSKLGAVATYKINVHVEIRYGVGMWFDVEGGRKTIDPPIGLDPGETYTYTIVLKNTGSTQDSFSLAVDDPREGWTQELLLNGERVANVRLDGGESANLQFRVRAPNTETAQQNIVSIGAQSASSALAADVVNTATRIRPKVDLELTLEPQTRLAAPNETVVFNITTRNKGNDVFTVVFEQDSILPKGWEARLSVPEITLNPNPSNDPTLNYVLQLAVTPPPGARAGDLASVKLAAEVDTGGGRVPGDEISAVVVVRRVYDLVTPPVADAEAFPGESLRFVLPIANQGNGQVSLELLPGAVEVVLLTPDGDERVVADWAVEMDVAALTLGLNETVELPLRLQVPNGTLPGLYNVSFTTRLSREALQNLTVPVQVKELARVDLVGSTSINLVPGRAMSLGYTARNTGNIEGVYDLRANAPQGWQASVTPARVRLAAGEGVPVTVTLNATRDAPDGQHIVRIESQAAGYDASLTDLRVRVARPVLFLEGVSASGALRAGELVLVTANVGNTGVIDATNVSVALTVDGRVVDRVLLSRVPVGSTSAAALSWVATQRGGDVKVVLDPEEEIALASRESTEADVKFGSRLGVPGPGLLAILAVLAAVAGLHSRARDAPTRRQGEKRSGAPSTSLMPERDEQ
ncbi:MAG TPA: CARDB domain-containing protein [Candidatus Thermoplasmatota archaeon]|nr:CARDB domain-containing protein [Candidatus Thermoplasmatota archaeon]